MNALVINGSPRKQGNTATLLKHTMEGLLSVGAKAEFINLYDLNYKGCSSCFACKKKGSKYIGRCAMKDDLTPVLTKTSSCDTLILGSPIYLGDITGEMRSFLERFVFMNLSYEKDRLSYFSGKLSIGFIYTMGIPDEMVEPSGYVYNFNMHMRYSQLFNGTSEYLISSDTYQFDDYSKYNATKFVEKHKAKVKTEQFPIDCQKAFDMGVRLFTS